MTFSPRIPFARVALLACALLACAAPGASAAHWPGFGGDAGRSGNQPVDAGGTPVTLLWEHTGATDENVRTSVLVSGGAASAQRVMYGTDDGVVHLRRLSDGGAVGGADIGDDADVFGTPDGSPGDNAASTSFADTSSDDALGQLFAAHNDGSGIQVAHFDEADGSLRQQLTVPGTTGMTLESSLLATPVRSDGSADLFFVAGGRLFKVPVGNARQRGASFGTASSTADVDATPLNTPTLAYLDVLGTPTAHVAIGTDDGDLRTYRVSDLAPGPAINPPDEMGLPPGSELLSVVVPVQADGRTPSPGSPLTGAPVLYASATSNVQIFGADSTAAFKLGQDDAGDLELTGAALFPGEPSPSLAVGQIAEPRLDDSKVLIATSASHFLASTRDFDQVGNFDTAYGLSGGTSGFQQTTGAVSGGYVYITNDRGEQYVLRLTDGKPVIDAQQFDRDGDNDGLDNGGVGQPAVSRGHVAFGGPDGVFVYRTTQATGPPPAPAEDTAPTVSFTAPAAGARLSGNPTLTATASDDRGIASVRFQAGERVICTDTAAPYECDYRPTADDVGRTTLVAVATDGAGQTGSALRSVGVNRFVPRSLSAASSPRTDRARPFRFTTRGTLRLPAGLTREQACGTGDVVVQLKAARKTISTRRAELSGSCGYRSRVTFRSRKRFPRNGRLSVRARFLGNAVLGPRRAKSATLRTR